MLTDLRTERQPLGDDARKCAPEEVRTVSAEREPVEERLHDGGELEEIVRRREDAATGGGQLGHHGAAVILERARRFSSLEAAPPSGVGFGSIVTEMDDVGLDVAEQRKMVSEPAHGIMRVPAPWGSNERGDLACPRSRAAEPFRRGTSLARL